MKFLRWCAGFVETGTPQAMTYLVTFMMALGILALTVALAWNITQIDWRVAGTIASTIGACGAVIGYVLRRGDDVKENGPPQ